MRFLCIALQFGLVLYAFRLSGKVLPESFSLLACAFTCVFLTAWIVEVTQESFLKKTVPSGGKAVLITGCDSGFGLALAKVLDERKFRVYACCLSSTSNGAQQLRDTCSSALQVVQLDVTDNQSVQNAKVFVREDLDDCELWAVVNNAGVLKGFHTELSSIQDYEDCLNVNTLGMVRVTLAFLPLLRKSRGRVVNICSIAGRVSCNFMAAYDMSKSASVVFSEVLMLEMREFGVKVISIEPEFFSTQMCSKEYLSKLVDSSVKSVDDEVKVDYGEAYIQKAKDIFISLFLASSPNTDLVIDAMVNAVSLEHPADTYKPTRNLMIRLFFLFAERTPWVIKYFFLSFAFYFIGLPKPKTGLNILQRFAI